MREILHVDSCRHIVGFAIAQSLVFAAIAAAPQAFGAGLQNPAVGNTAAEPMNYTGIRDVRIGLGKPPSGQMLTITTAPNGDPKCKGDRTLPCTPAQVKALADALKANNAGVRILSLANPDGTLTCVTTSGDKCTLAHFAAWSQIATAGPAASASSAANPDGGTSIYCPKGQVERGGKCVNGDIPNNVTSIDAPTHDPKLGTGNGPYKPPPPPAPGAAAGVVNSSRSNIKNNLAVADPSGPLSVTGVTCNGTSSVSVTTNYAVPPASTWVFPNPTTRNATLFPPNQSVRGVNGQPQFALNMSNASYSLVIENNLGISILPNPYVFICGPSSPIAAPGSQRH